MFSEDVVPIIAFLILSKSLPRQLPHLLGEGLTQKASRKTQVIKVREQVDKQNSKEQSYQRAEQGGPYKAHIASQSPRSLEEKKTQVRGNGNTYSIVSLISDGTLLNVYFVHHPVTQLPVKFPMPKDQGHTYMHPFSFKLHSHPGCRKTLSSVPCAVPVGPCRSSILNIAEETQFSNPFFFGLCGMQDPSSLTRGGTCALCPHNNAIKTLSSERLRFNPLVLLECYLTASGQQKMN